MAMHVTTRSTVHSENIAAPVSMLRLVMWRLGAIMRSLLEAKPTRPTPSARDTAVPAWHDDPTTWRGM